MSVIEKEIVEQEEQSEDVSAPMTQFRDFLNDALTQNQLDRALTFIQCLEFVKTDPSIADALIEKAITREIESRARHIRDLFIDTPNPNVANRNGNSKQHRLDPLVAAFKGRLMAAEIRNGLSMADAVAADLEKAYNAARAVGMGSMTRAYYYRLAWERVDGTGRKVKDMLTEEVLQQLHQQAENKADKL